MNSTQLSPEQTDSQIPQTTPSSGKNMPLLLTILAALAMASGFLWWFNRFQDIQAPVYAPRELAPTVEADLNADLNQAEPADLDKEFEEVDAGINNL